MTDGDKQIRRGFYPKELFEIQLELLVKPVRFLTRAHVEPNNLEKMKVGFICSGFIFPREKKSQPVNTFFVIAVVNK